MKKVFLTTTLPYINSVPHIGHALELTQADFISRYLKGKGNDVVFSTGTDEHGLKVHTAAQANNIDTQEHCDRLARTWEEFIEVFHIIPDVFWRTTRTAHKIGVKTAWEICYTKGDIYLKEYNGYYCVGCESFKTEKDLVDGKCPEHLNLDIKQVSENNYFFKLSKYREHLANWLENNTEFITPKTKYEELKNLIDDIEDISISRLKTSVPWGIEVPNDDTQNIYVWFEALCNYVLAAGWNSSDDFLERWNESVQLCGPDNLRFQGVIWQGILASLEIPQTKKLLVHGTVLDKDGVKISKSLGNVVDPIEKLNVYGLSAVRYYILAGLPTFSNTNWNDDELKSLYNAHLANNLGNLVNRIITLVLKGGYQERLSERLVTESFKSLVLTRLEDVDRDFDSYEIRLGIEGLNKLNNYANQILTSEEPWKKSPDEAFIILNDIYWYLTKIAPYYYSVLPEKKDIIEDVLYGFNKKIIFERIL